MQVSGDTFYVISSLYATSGQICLVLKPPSVTANGRMLKPRNNWSVVSTGKDVLRQADLFD